jgi:hypothetical protein
MEACCEDCLSIKIKNLYEELRQQEVGKIYHGYEILHIRQESIYNRNRNIVKIQCQYDSVIFDAMLDGVKRGLYSSCSCIREEYIQHLIDFYNENGYFLGYVYQIKNIITGALYIGKTYNKNSRWYQHDKELKLGVHHSKLLQEDFEKYGIKAFEFKIIKEYKFENIKNINNQLSKYEIELIHQIKPIYNSQHAMKYTKIEEQCEITV